MRKLSKVLLIGSFILTLGACGNQTETITKITLQVQAVYRHTDDFGSIYTLDQKGNIELEKYSSEKKTAKASAEDFEALCQDLTKHGVLKFPEELEPDLEIMDGTSYSLKIETTAKSYSFEGDNPRKKQFVSCAEQIMDYCDKHLE